MRPFPRDIGLDHEPFIFTDCCRFHQWLRQNQFEADIMTYTVTDVPPWLTVHRLVYQIGKAAVVKLAADRRKVDDCHSKLWLLYAKAGVFRHAYVGSLNLVTPTNTNLMCQAPYGRDLKKWFDQVWDKLKP